MTPVRDLNDLYFFAKVADFGSYTAAAKALGLQTSKLTQATTQHNAISRARVAASPLLTIAGIWDRWRDPENDNAELHSCAMVITEPNEFVAEVHDRMPVLLRPTSSTRGSMARPARRCSRPRPKTCCADGQCRSASTRTGRQRMIQS